VSCHKPLRIPAPLADTVPFTVRAESVPKEVTFAWAAVESVPATFVNVPVGAVTVVKLAAFPYTNVPLTVVPLKRPAVTVVTVMEPVELEMFVTPAGTPVMPFHPTD
jgi:hypothetical protein